MSKDKKGVGGGKYLQHVSERTSWLINMNCTFKTKDKRGKEIKKVIHKEINTTDM